MAVSPRTKATPNQLARSEAILHEVVRAVAADPSRGAAISSLGTYLQECETMLVQYLSGKEPTPAPGVEVEFGLTLYYLDNHLSKEEQNILGLPPTQITTTQYNKWISELSDAGIVAWDGTLVGTGTYEALDTGWASVAMVHYLAVKAGLISKYPFGTTPQTITVTQSSVRIVLVGDWGTGIWTDGSLTCPSQAVMSQIKQLTPAPDYVVHLGDVYYAGTESVLIVAGEEQDNFVTLWPSQFANSLALDSNHEMYDGANGYFKDALGASAFSLQNNTSYFALQGPTSSSPNWAVVGLDSAYSDTSSVFMLGSIDSAQQSFLSGFQNVPLVLILSHHNGITTDGATTNDPLFSQVQSSLGSNSTVMWYWGHVHNGIVYTANSAAGSILARCAGHGAIPFGNAPYLDTVMQQQNSPIEYYAATPLKGGNAQQANRVLNGFVVIDLANVVTNGQVTGTSVTETFIDQEGNTAWTNSFTCSS